MTSAPCIGDANKTAHSDDLTPKDLRLSPSLALGVAVIDSNLLFGHMEVPLLNTLTASGFGVGFLASWPDGVSVVICNCHSILCSWDV